MKVKVNTDGSILLTPETEGEKIGLDYDLATRGITGFKEIIEKHVNQRKEQRDYDEIMQLHNSLNDLPEADRKAILDTTHNNIKAKKVKKNG